MEQNLTIDQASKEKADWVARCLYNIAPTVMDYLYGEKAQPFLQFAYQHNHGYLGVGIHKFVIRNNEVVAIYATYNARQNTQNTFKLLMGIIRFFPFLKALKIINKSASLSYRTALPKKGEHYISSLYVDKEHRATGIAGWVMRQEINYAKLNGFSSVDLDVDIDNKSAIRLYHRIGFRVTKENNDVHSDETKITGTYRMQYQL